MDQDELISCHFVNETDVEHFCKRTTYYKIEAQIQKTFVIYCKTLNQ